MKALEKDRTRRYETADDLGKDVTRYLNDEPVEACPPSAVYRLRKFARRHRTMFAAGAAVIMALVVGAAVSTAQAIRATKAEGLAEDRLTVADRQTRLAKRQQQLAEHQKKLALQQERLAQQQKEEAVRQRNTAQRNLYLASMRLAPHDWNAGQIRRLRVTLDAQVPSPGWPEFRGWEWYYYLGLCHTDLLTIRGHRSQVPSLSFSPDGRLLASAGQDCALRLWDVATGQLAAELRGHTRPMMCVAFSPDGKRLASGGGDRTIRIWDAATGKQLVSQRLATTDEDGPDGDVWSISWSPDGREIAAAVRLASATIRDGRTGEEIRRLPLRHMRSVGYSSDGTRLALGGMDGTVHIWGTAEWKPLRALGQSTPLGRAHSSPVVFVGWSLDGRQVATAAEHRELKIWNVESGREVLAMHGHTAEIRSAAWSRDSRYLASASDDGTVLLWDTATGHLVRTLRGHTDDVWPVAFSPDSQRLASASWGGVIKIWDAPGEEDVPIVRGHTEGIRDVAFSPDGRWLASASEDGTVKIWNPASRQEIQSLPGDGARVVSLSWSPNSRHLASAAANGVIRIWASRTGTEILTLSGERVAGPVAFSPDGRRLATDSRNHSLRILDAATGKEIAALRAFSQNLKSLAFSPDGRRLAVRGDNEIKIWNVGDGRELLRLKAVYGEATVSFSPDGRWLASTIANQKICVWDTKTGATVALLSGHLARLLPISGGYTAWAR
ncbi:MAG: WD40 domain-containing protein [Planctomycetota bacterium]